MRDECGGEDVGTTTVRTCARLDASFGSEFPEDLTRRSRAGLLQGLS